MHTQTLARYFLIKQVLLIALFTLTQECLAQVDVFRNYRFEKGGYSIVGVRAESDRNEFADSLGQFYSSDVAVLNLFKQQWRFKKRNPQYACGYHYAVSVCRGGKELETFLINLNCNVIATDSGYYFFDDKLLRKLKGKLHKPAVKRQSFRNTAEARIVYTHWLSDPNLLMVEFSSSLDAKSDFRFVYDPLIARNWETAEVRLTSYWKQ
jgi:hypothetical protein